MVEPLSTDELQVIRDLREDEELTFEQIGERLGVDTSTAQRVYSEPGRSFSDLTVIRMRKHIARIVDGRKGAKPRRQKALS